MLPLIKELVFDEEWHSYSVNGIKVPSVTRIMKPITAQIYGEIDKEVLQRASERGKAVHFAIELYDDTGYVEIDDEYRPYFNAYLEWADLHNPKILATEYRFYHPSYWYAGTLDKVVQIKDELVLLDIKTTAVLNDWLVSIQLGAYREGLKAHGIQVDKLAVLHLDKSGRFVYKELEDNFHIFLSCMQIQNFLKSKGVKV